ncbi:MAG: hypothetical protein ONB44_15425 [candidate division KSB1 bacterium]|nr:hypothetical protein [candidate division KSB1 bacterium]MDZ7303521.1 hypothetical protein [candidate division KSB1 bacterium]MDZ7312677.1 hypothetical protein [candidate division KSB1 bacterium]
MSFSPEPFAPVAVDCPFMDRPCPQGAAQGLQCQLRVAQQDFDPMSRFHDAEVIFCALCQKEILLSVIPRSQVRPDKT